MEDGDGDALRTSYQTPQVNRGRLIREMTPRGCGTGGLYDQTGR